MDILDSIANYSMSLSQTQLMSQISMQVLDMSLETSQGAANEMALLMEHSVTPHLGSNIDIMV